jgi:hypothetical protein
MAALQNWAVSAVRIFPDSFLEVSGKAPGKRKHSTAEGNQRKSETTTNSHK